MVGCNGPTAFSILTIGGGFSGGVESNWSIGRSLGEGGLLRQRDDSHDYMGATGGADSVETSATAPRIRREEVDIKEEGEDENGG